MTAAAGASTGRQASSLADGQWHRMHPATPLLRGGIAVVAVLGVVLANLRERIVDLVLHVRGPRDGDPVDALVRHGWVGWAALAALMVIGLAIAFYRLSWRMQSFRVTGEAVELRSGIVFRSSRQARLDRIQGVNVHRPLLARLFGAARLEIVVAGHDANLHLSYLSSAPAEQLRRDILGIAHRAQTAGHQDAAQTEPGYRPEPGTLEALVQDRVEEFVLDPADLHADGATDHAIVRVHPGRLAASMLVHESTVVYLLVVAGFIVWASLGHPWVLIALLPTLFGLVSGYVRRFSRVARYSLSGTQDGVRIGYGLIGTSSETIPAGRIHAVELHQPLLWRPFGWWQLRMNRAGDAKQRGQAESASTLLPVGTLADVERVLPLVLPGADAARLAVLVADTSAHGRAKNTYFSQPPRTAAWLHPFSWRRIGQASAGEVVVLRRGILWRQLDFVPLARVQSLALRQGPLRRLLGLASLHVHLVEGRVRPVLPVIGVEAGRTLYEELAAAMVAHGAVG